MKGKKNLHRGSMRRQGIWQSRPSLLKRKRAGGDGVKVTEGSRVKLEDSIFAIRRSLEFLGPHVEATGGSSSSEMAQDHNMG